MGTFLDSYMKDKGTTGVVISFEDFIRRADFKDIFEFGLWCYDEGEEIFNKFLRYVLFTYEDFYDSCYHDNEVIENCDSSFISLLSDYIEENHVKLSQCSEEMNIRGNIFDELNLVRYLFSFYEGYDSLSNVNEWGLWLDYISHKLGFEVKKAFLKEWDELTHRLGYSEEWKDRDMTFGVANFVAGSLRFTYDFYDHNGLSINTEFVDGNALIDRNELMDWCEYVVNGTFRDLGLRYDKTKVEEFEKVEEQELELEQEMGR